MIKTRGMGIISPKKMPKNTSSSNKKSSKKYDVGGTVGVNNNTGVTSTQRKPLPSERWNAALTNFRDEGLLTPEEYQRKSNYWIPRLQKSLDRMRLGIPTELQERVSLARSLPRQQNQTSSVPNELEKPAQQLRQQRMATGGLAALNRSKNRVR